MLKERSWRTLSLLLITACLIAAATAVVAGEDDDEIVVDKRVEVIVKKIADCEEGEADCEHRMADCEHRMVVIGDDADCGDEGADCERRMVVIGDDGEQVEIGGDAVWAGDHGHHGMHRLHHGKSGFLGVQMTELTPELRAHFGVPEDAGVMVSKVVDDSPASRAGVQVGDIISAVDGEAVGSAGALARAIRGREDGEAATLEIWRDGGLETLTANLEVREGHGVRHRKRAIRVHHDGDHDFDCGGAGDCEIHVECDEGDCNCTVNGEAADCEDLHGDD